jgi:cell wall-associated NlpC family hydrolase
MELDNKFLKLTPEQQKKIIDTALALIGKPYKLGYEILDLSIMPDKVPEIDCSELTQYVYYQAGFDLVDGSYNQFDISDTYAGELAPGDLLFKRKKTDNLIGHVGLYIGQNQVIESNGFYECVVRTSIKGFSIETKNFIFAGIRRLLVSKIKTH